MKKIILLAVTFLLTVAISGCGQYQVHTNNANTLRVVSTIFAPYDFTRAIAGDKAEITMLLPPGSEAHSFEPTPMDIITIQNCDIFIYTGGESDEWVNEVLSSMDLDKMKIITLMDCVEPVNEEIVEGMEYEEEHEKHGRDPEYDEHVWTSPKNAKLIAEKISTALCESDSKNADYYRTKTETYLNELIMLDEAFQTVTDNAQRKTIIFADRFPFRYLADAYGLEYYAAFPGCSSETEASAKTIAFLIDKINEEKIPVIFHAELANEKMSDTISEATGAKVMLLHACHNITKDEFAKGVTYLELMYGNVKALSEALI